MLLTVSSSASRTRTPSRDAAGRPSRSRRAASRSVGSIPKDRLKQTVVPLPSSLTTDMLPPIRSMRRLQMDNPRPEPSWLRA